MKGTRSQLGLTATGGSSIKGATSRTQPIPQHHYESDLSLFFHIAVPFVLGGFGTCFAGVIFHEVQNWAVFKRINEILILLPALQALKGNLHMTLASRMSTHSHMGHIHGWDELKILAIPNIALNQILSITIGILASAVAIIIHAFLSFRMFELDDALLVMVTGLVTCSVASVFLDCVMILVIYGAQIYKIDPDDVATPIAASLGDITSLSLYAFLAKMLNDASNDKYGDHTVFNIVCFTVILVYVLLLPIWFAIVKNNIYTANVLCQGSYWYPLISAMFVCTISGLILDAALVHYSGIALFHPVICGVGGNLVAIQASKLSSFLHQQTKLGQLPGKEKVCLNPLTIVLMRPTSKTTRILLLIAIPGHIMFFFTCSYLSKESPPITVKFLISYVVAAELQVFILLYLAYTITYALWMGCVDPDNTTIPYLTSMGDVIGAAFITIIFVGLSMSKTESPTEEEESYKNESFGAR